MALLSISGIEATQSIQIGGGPPYRGQQTGGLPGSIGMVANRRTVLRVWASGAEPGTRLFAHTQVGTSFAGQSISRFSNWIDAPVRTVSRLRADQSMQIPLHLPVVGTHTYVVHLSEWNRATAQWRHAMPWPLTLTFVERRNLRVRLVRIRYRGRGLNLAPVTTTDVWNALEFAQRVLPLATPGIEVVHDSVEDYDGDFTRIDPSAHDMTWAGFAANRGTTGNLLNIMDRLKSSEGRPRDVVYLGIYPAGANQAQFAGWAVGGWCLSSLAPEIIAHELAHRLCVPMHAPCGGPVFVDRNFPLFQGLPDGSIGDVGLDTFTETTRDPATHFDLMSYCGPRWISAYNYKKAFDCLAPPPPPAATPPPQFSLPTTIPVRLVRLPPDRWTKVPLPPLPLPFPRPPRGQDARHDAAAALMLDARGESLARVDAWMGPSGSETDADAGTCEFELPQSDRAAALRVELDGTVLWEWTDKTVGDPLALSVDWPPASELSKGAGTLSWRLEGEGEHVVVRASSDDGRSWRASVLDGASGQLALDRELLGHGGQVVLQVWATRGLRSVHVQSEPVHVEAVGRALLLLAPTDGAAVSCGQRLRFAAISVDPAAAITWCSDRDGVLGVGAELAVDTLTPGRHRIEARSAVAFELPVQFSLRVRGARRRHVEPT